MKSPRANIKNNKKYVFFISHSTKDIAGDVGEICKVLEKCRIKNFIADRDAQIGKSLPLTIKKAIESSELFLVVLTSNSKRSLWVNQEIGYALGRKIPVIPLKKGKIGMEGLIDSVKYIPMKGNPLDTVKEIFSKLNSTPLSTKAEAAIMAVVGILELIAKDGGSTS